MRTTIFTGPLLLWIMAVSVSCRQSADIQQHQQIAKDIATPDFSSEPVLKPRSQPAVPGKFKETPFIETNPAITAMPQENTRGYILFSRPITAPVYKRTIPQAEERVQSLSAFATPGEYEPLTFSFYPLRNMKNIRLKVSKLHSRDSTIGKNNLDLRAVTYWNMRYPSYSSAGNYRAVPELLEKVNSIDLQKGISQRFWLKIHVPSDAVPGLYEGYITIYETGAEKGLQLPIAIRVLEYKLKRDPAKRYSVYYYPSNYQFPGLKGAELKKAQRTEFESMLSYGIDMLPVIQLATEADDNGKIKLIFRDEETLNLLLEMGFKGPIPVSGSIGEFYKKYVPDGKAGSHCSFSKAPTDDKMYKAIEEAYRRFKKYAENKGYPELICCPLDEPEASSAEISAKIYAAIRRGGVKTYITKDPTSGDTSIYKKYNAIDIWCSQAFSMPYEKVITDTDYEYWCYPNDQAGELKDRVVAQKGGRMTYGFGFWRSGYTTLIPWHWRWRGRSSTSPFNYLQDKKVSGCGVRIDENYKTIPTVYWECFREGYDDLRYLYTLQDAIIQREGSSDKKCKALITESKKLIQKIWDSIIQQQQYLNIDMWADQTFNARRWQIAVLTQKLLAFTASNSNVSPSVPAYLRITVEADSNTSFIRECIKKGYLDQYNLADNSYKNWSTSNKEVELDVNNAGENTESMQFNVHIDHNSDGEGSSGKYPIGWPRISHYFDKDKLDLTKYDYLYFKVKIDSNRTETDTDTTPFVINFATHTGKKYDKHLDLGGKQNVWVPVFISMKDMIKSSSIDISQWTSLKRLQLVIYERKYMDDTELRFEIKDISFMKFNRPVIKNINSANVVILPLKSYPISIAGYGFETATEHGANIRISLTNDSEKTILSETHPLNNNTQYRLDFNDLVPGEYKITVAILGSQKTPSTTYSKNIKLVKGFL